MKVIVYSKEIEIGWAELTRFDPPMGCAAGDFYPNDNYKTIQAVIRQKNDCTGTLGNYDEIKFQNICEQIKELALSVRATSQEILNPAGGVHITDYADELENEPDARQLDILGLDTAIFNRLFPGEYEKYENQFSRQ